MQISSKELRMILEGGGVDAALKDKLTKAVMDAYGGDAMQEVIQAKALERVNQQMQHAFGQVMNTEARMALKLAVSEKLDAKWSLEKNLREMIHDEAKKYLLKNVTAVVQDEYLGVIEKVAREHAPTMIRLVVSEVLGRLNQVDP